MMDIWNLQLTMKRSYLEGKKAKKRGKGTRIQCRK
jgi:hypothetical protein